MFYVLYCSEMVNVFLKLAFLSCLVFGDFPESIKPYRDMFPSFMNQLGYDPNHSYYHSSITSSMHRLEEYFFRRSAEWDGELCRKLYPRALEKVDRELYHKLIESELGSFLWFGGPSPVISQIPEIFQNKLETEVSNWMHFPFVRQNKPNFWKTRIEQFVDQTGIQLERFRSTWGIQPVFEPFACKGLTFNVCVRDWISVVSASFGTALESVATNSKHRKREKDAQSVFLFATLRSNYRLWNEILGYDQEVNLSKKHPFPDLPKEDRLARIFESAIRAGIDLEAIVVQNASVDLLTKLPTYTRFSGSFAMSNFKSFLKKHLPQLTQYPSDDHMFEVMSHLANKFNLHYRQLIESDTSINEIELAAINEYAQSIKILSEKLTAFKKDLQNLDDRIQTIRAVPAEFRSVLGAFTVGASYHFASSP